MADETRLSAGSIQWPCASDDLTLLRGNPRAPPSTSHLTSQRRPRRSNASRLSVSASSRRTFLPCSMNRVRLGTYTRSHAISRSSFLAPPPAVVQVVEEHGHDALPRRLQ